MPFPVAAAIGAGVGLLGGLFKSSAQKSANKANLQAVRETNAQNLQIYNDQKQYNTDMWNAQNAYNTPTAQRQRYEDAGINPYLALGNISSGSAESSLTAPNAPKLTAPQVQPVTGMAEAIGQSAGQYADILMALTQAKKVDAETQGQQIDNMYKAGMYQAQINQMDQYTKNAFTQGELLSLDKYYRNSTMDDSISQVKQDLNNSIEQGRFLKVQADLAQFDLNFKNKHAEEQFKAELAKQWMEVRTGYMNAESNRIGANASMIGANASMMNAQTNRYLSYYQAQDLAQQVVESTERTTGIHIDNETARKCQRFIVNKTAAEAFGAHYNANISRKSYESFDTDKVYRRAGMIIGGVQEGVQTGFGVKQIKGAPKPKPIKGFKVGGFK